MRSKWVVLLGLTLWAILFFTLVSEYIGHPVVSVRLLPRLLGSSGNYVYGSTYPPSHGENANNKVHYVEYEKSGTHFDSSSKREENKSSYQDTGGPIHPPCATDWYNGMRRTFPGSSVSTETADGGAPLLVIFTSFKNVAHRTRAHTNTLNNWALYQPDVLPVLFNDTTDPQLLDLAAKLGWKILNLHEKLPHEAPRLKWMYLEVAKHFKASFTGFCNGDILFDDGLVKTLKVVKSKLSVVGQGMVTGGRYNVNLTDRIIHMSDDVKRIASREAKPPAKIAVDFFFLLNNYFDWAKILDKLVIGRVAYDNYFVAKARLSGVPVVDVSCTVTALHQMGFEGTLAGTMNKDNTINWDLIGPFNYDRGFLSATDLETNFNGNDSVELTVRMKNVLHANVLLRRGVI